ncbi:MAG: flavin reductase family protein [Muribaculaceae bacterium]|nr:flavin reductase family protein [Muribaculaceae bacterium]
MKQQWRPGTMVYPLPAALVSCGSGVDDSNLLTVAWTGTICSDPAMLYISVRPERYSYNIIRKNMEFTLNLTTEALAAATDRCGVTSGRDRNKWTENNLTPRPGIKVSCPYIEESPLSIECRVRSIIPLGSHDMFLAEVVNVLADDRYINPETGAFDLLASGLMAYAHGGYYSLGQKRGKFGFSVEKKKKSKK